MGAGRGGGGKAKLLPHEAELVASGAVSNVSHMGATSAWLTADSTAVDPGSGLTTVYRHMGDEELAHLRANGVLPDTQPYQTIVEGDKGRAYCEGYLRGHRKPSGNVVTTVVEFVAPKALVDRLFAMFCKPEEGCLSHGLGDKGGKGLPLFNASLASGETTFRIVTVKRKV